jgi:hypothetical protein
MADIESIRASNLVDHLRRAISDGTAGLSDVPLLVKQIIESGAWRTRIVSQTKELVYFSSFREFAEALPPDGLGKTIRELERLCAGDVEALDLLAGQTQTPKRGGDRRSNKFKSNNVTLEKHTRGNSAVYSLRRLREARPDLHKRVLEKEISINQAMIEAGLRRKTLIIASDVLRICAAIKEKFNSGQIAEIIEQLQGE